MTAHRNDPYWVIVLDEEMTRIANLHASKQMIAKYDIFGREADHKLRWMFVN